jgi:hypothetical protein
MVSYWGADLAAHWRVPVNKREDCIKYLETTIEGKEDVL